MYSDENLALMNYDFAISDDELDKILNGQELSDGQLTIEDFIGGDASSYESIFQAVDSDGLEEITGNYIPDNSQ